MLFFIIVFMFLFVSLTMISKKPPVAAGASLLIVALLEVLLIKNEPFHVVEGMKSGSGKKKKKKKKSAMEKYLNKDSKYNFDLDSTVLENYRRLTPEQVGGLNSDTKELIDTQKKLMGTLKEMGPVLEQGKSIISAFDGFFKDPASQTDDLEFLKAKKILESAKK
jgi:hypothetical protein